jgi:predicted DsbA family dithiol-disulfide isomerase
LEPVRLITYSDYLCPWCYNATARLWRIEEEFGDSVDIEWRSFLLRPSPGEKRDLEKFVRYTQSWLRPGAEPDAPTFRVWQSSEGPPSHSVPPHLVAKTAASLGRAEFREIHGRLMRSYFEESRDITAAATLRAIWSEAGLPAAEFERSKDPAFAQATLRQHQEAVEHGVSGVPATGVAGSDLFIVGAHPLELYRRWIRRLLSGELDPID